MSSQHSDNISFVSNVQSFLNSRGFSSGKVDGWAGQNTQAAFAAFLKSLSVPPASMSAGANPSSRLYAHALKDLGLKEVSGPSSNPRIREAILGAASWLDPDDSVTAWCGCIMGLWCKEIGLPVPPEYYRAVNWRKIGTSVRLSGAIPGDVVILQRSGGYHVGLFDSTSDSQVRLLGGNQSNQVSLAWFPASLIVDIRRIS